MTSSVPDEVQRGGIGSPQAAWLGLDRHEVVALPIEHGLGRPPRVHLSRGGCLTTDEARQLATYLTAAADWAEQERAQLEREIRVAS